MGCYTVGSGAAAILRGRVGRLLEKTRVWRPFGRGREESQAARDDDRSPRLAVATLLLEVAHADGALSAGERHYVEWLLCREFGLGRGEAQRLLRAAEIERGDGVDLEEAAALIVRKLSKRQRRHLSRFVEELAHVNRAPTREQDYAVRRISNLLRQSRPA